MRTLIVPLFYAILSDASGSTPDDDYQVQRSAYYHNMGDVELERGDRTTALKYFKKARAAHETLRTVRSVAHVHKEQYDRSGKESDLEKATEGFARAIELAPHDVVSLLMYGTCLSASGESHAEVVEVWKRAARAAVPETVPGKQEYVLALHSVGANLAESGAPADAVRALRRAFEVNEDLGENAPPVPGGVSQDGDPEELTMAHMLAEGIATLEVWLKKQTTSEEVASDEPDTAPKRKKRKKAKKAAGENGPVHEL